MEKIRFGPPQKLYDLCLNAAYALCVSDLSLCKLCRKEFRVLPNHVLLDFYAKLYEDKRLCILAGEFSEFEIFCYLLHVQSKRHILLKCYQAILNHGTNISETIFKKFSNQSEEPKHRPSLIDVGLRIGSLFNEGGWYPYSIKFLDVTEKMCLKEKETVDIFRKLLECYKLKIYAEAIYCQFESADKTREAAEIVIDKLQALNAVPNLAGLYINFSLFYFNRSDYNESYKWSQKALKLLTNGLPERVVIDVLKQASKSCVVKRNFSQAGLLIRQAMNLGEMLYKTDQHPYFSNILMDYGFYLLNYDSIKESVTVYKRALELRIKIFEKNNILIAIGHEDLAYALYVNEYSSGVFWLAKEHAEKSIKIMEKVLPKDHLMLASVKRVKALILEEIALEERNNDRLQFDYLKTAEKLHRTALELSHKSFGEKNVQTAKHYGNLGRLYQSMRYFEEAEQMHLKAISIKEELLGKNDYEVGLSIGHLASLYNYHMKKYKEAEKLYLRSIDINLNIFGPSYSGLEYDYRGLINVYVNIVEPTSAMNYTRKMRDWKLLRENINPVEHKEPLLSPKEIVKRFFEMEAKTGTVNRNECQ